MDEVSGCTGGGWPGVWSEDAVYRVVSATYHNGSATVVLQGRGETRCKVTNTGNSLPQTVRSALGAVVSEFPVAVRFVDVNLEPVAHRGRETNVQGRVVIEGAGRGIKAQGGGQNLAEATACALVAAVNSFLHSRRRNLARQERLRAAFPASQRSPGLAAV